MSGRATQLISITGTNGTGKSTVIKELVNTAVKNGDRALIVTPDEVEWPSVPLVHQRLSHHIQNYVGARKIVAYDDDFIEKVDLIIKYFRQGVLVFDDMMAYNKHSTHPLLKRLMVRRRHMEVDIIAVGHSFTEIPPRFYSFISDFILFRSSNDVMKRQDFLGKGLAKVLEQKQDLVNQKSKDNLHHHQYFTRAQLLSETI